MIYLEYERVGTNKLFYTHHFIVIVADILNIRWHLVRSIMQFQCIAIYVGENDSQLDWQFGTNVRDLIKEFDLIPLNPNKCII